MLLSRLERSLLLAQRGPLLSPPDGEGGGSGGGEGSGANANANSDANPGGKQGEEGKGGEGEGKIEFSAEQQKHVDKLIGDARKDASRIAAEKAKNDADAAAEQARKDKESEDAKKAGDFEKVETQLKGDLKTAQDEATALKGENDQLREAMKSGIEAGWKELPEEVRKLGEKQHPEEDVLGRFQFLNDPDTKALVARLGEKADPKWGNGQDPKPSGNGKAADADKQKSQAGIYRNF